VVLGQHWDTEHGKRDQKTGKQRPDLHDGEQCITFPARR
jgi:hypothetical protein